METTTQQSNISFTPSAIAELKLLMQQDNFDTSHKLRIGVKGGGCSGLSYVLGFDQIEEGDEIFEIQEMSVIIKKEHLLYLAGMQIDYGKGLDARGFIFNNPNASSSCGCGTSFAI